MADPVEVRAAVDADVDAVFRIDADRADAQWSRESVAAEIGHAGAVVIVAEAATGIVGFCAWRRLPDVNEITNIGVAESARRRGLATRLVGAAIADCRERGVSLLLEVADSNTGARALYEGMGFALIGRRRRYYRSGADALLMRMRCEATSDPPGSPSDGTSGATSA